MKGKGGDWHGEEEGGGEEQEEEEAEEEEEEDSDERPAQYCDAQVEKR